MYEKTFIGKFGVVAARKIRMKSDTKPSPSMLVFRGLSCNGEPVATGIFKEPVASRLMIRTLNLDGDRQADVSFHGGPSKAAYAYPAEHYEFWMGEFPEMNLPWGMFSENLHNDGLLESKINIGNSLHWLCRGDSNPAAHALLQARHEIRSR